MKGAGLVDDRRSPGPTSPHGTTMHQLSRMIRLMTLVAVSLIVGVSVPSAQGLPQRRGAHSAGGTLPASVVAAVTWLTYGTDRGEDPGLLVIWRGTPGWYRERPASSSGGGSRDAYRHTNRYGDTEVSFVLTASPRTLTVQDSIEVDIGTHTVVLRRVRPSVVREYRDPCRSSWPGNH